MSSSLRILKAQSVDVNKQAWFVGFKSFLAEVPNLPLMKYQYENYAAELKDILLDFMVLSALAATLDAKQILRACVLKKTVALCLESKALGCFKEDAAFLAKLDVVMTRLINQADMASEMFLKNRLLVLLPKYGVVKTISTISDAAQGVAKFWDVQNYLVDQDFLTSLLPWLEQNVVVAKKLFLNPVVSSKKSQLNSGNKKKAARETLGKQFLWVSAFLSVLSILFSGLQLFEVMDYASIPMIACSFLAMVYAFKGIEYFPFFSIDKETKKKWIDSVGQFLVFSFSEPKIKKQHEIKFIFDVPPIESVDYSMPNEIQEHTPNHYRLLVAEMDKNKKPSSVSTSSDDKIETIDPENKSMDLYTDIHFINTKRLSFKHQNIHYHACLDEEALPNGSEGKAIRLAFQKGPMRTSADRSVHAIVKASKSDFCLFKIRTAYKGRLKASSCPIDADNVELNFDLYDRNSHDARRRLRG